MAAKPLPDQALLLKLLRYEPETGKLFWRERPIEMFSDGGKGRAKNCSIWNERHAGTEAAPCPSPKGSKGYRLIGLFKSKFLAHRLIWKMMTDDEPPEIDHINGNKADNRFCNLRASDTKDNKRNLRTPTHNKSGTCGVFWNKQLNRWHAHITVNGKTYHLGVHLNKDDAIRARKAGERRFGFHPNHGRKGKLA